ncbi:MAG: LPS-assembly protein LptD [Burkholderiales bacterium]|nr:LPS-assembly protein LptD [Burkholderiales bacterium]
MRLNPLAVAAALLAGGQAAWAQQAQAPVAPASAASAGKQGPIVLDARQLSGQAGLDVRAEGDVELSRDGMVIRADHLSYEPPEDRAHAKGNVRVERSGAVYSGPEVELSVQRFEGWFLEPHFEFTQLRAGGHAARVDFLGDGRSRAIDASYTSCPRDGPGEPAWVLRADRVDIDLDANEGVAEGAVLHFLGQPILALPTMSFALGDTRRSGWLPPTVGIDNRSGLDLAVPYYWNIAPNRDATITPRIITRRGFGADLELRYLEPAYAGELQLDALPDDRVTKRSRGSLQWTHDGLLPWGVRARADLTRVSDDDWWRDFPGRLRSLTPRLLATHAGFERPLGLAASGDGIGLVDGRDGVEGLTYLRTTRWQVLQASDAPIVAPYERALQFGVQLDGRATHLQWSLQSEFNRFILPSNDAGTALRTDGERAHVLAAASLPWRAPGWWVVPRLALNAAGYRWPDAVSGEPRRAWRAIPTFSIDAGLELERQTQAFGRQLRQTLEPRVMYVNTPYRLQSDLPDFDAAGKDFNFASIYSDNAFSGIDRVADAHQITAGVTTRLVDLASGAEALRLGIAQRYLLRPQLVTAQADGTVDGPPTTGRFSDLLLLGSTSVLPSWKLDASVQYNADVSRPVRSIVGVRYAPAPFHTLSANYRYARGLSEQIDVGWQWPILARAMAARGAGSGGSCSGSLYTVGRVNYSMRDRRVTDSLLGLEYDAGCWIARVVAERLSTGSTQATTRLMLQLELVGLSRLGSNPLQALRDNIPGYEMLRGEGAPASGPSSP